jgi:hypothetical protein
MRPVRLLWPGAMVDEILLRSAWSNSITDPLPFVISGGVSFLTQKSIRFHAMGLHAFGPIAPCSCCGRTTDRHHGTMGDGLVSTLAYVGQNEPPTMAR